ncbi:polyprenyl synthetase family protein [Pseudomonas sp. NFACC05-1]|uniref:polyprenyl synthetase family protein n=1 Tax=Pseudomonas sp. NFACC05-1 TaxID=1566241 RepID=UPI0008714114|nr:polyprenyl synthetase family protein [Pseudomonas sp. NFACC05-1]SCW75055.1 heptaprenyl diphosphate synthase [Pseudomonas sp. NFACC05-1]
MSASDSIAVVIAQQPTASSASVYARISEELLAEDLVRFRQEVELALEPQAPYLTDVERQMFAGGKKIRPLVMLLSARLIAQDGPLPDKVYKGAASLEMLHVATLIHDDIVDEAQLRRGLPSVSAARGSKTALLIGDLQFVQALRGFATAVDTERDMTLVRLVLDTAFDICRGELDELDRTLPEDHDARLARYYQTIDRKTAVLFRLACQGGIDLAGGRSRDARRGGFFGRALGRAFQIMDDVLDVVEYESSAGKQSGIDLLLGRLSLPLIYAMETLGPTHAISQSLREGTPLTGHRLGDALDDLRDCGCIDKAYAAARREALQALFYLEPFPPGRYRDALEELALHVVDRPLNG